ncbi:MAG: hypothetical protein IAF38_10030, partial [Bacteroidia bacterium]|nr:hypothetical protein [Bacteroidia bacterium]
MKRIFTLVFTLGTFVFAANAQKNNSLSAYEIKVKPTGIKDSLLYLCIYTFDKQHFVDTALRAKDGTYTFKKKRTLDKGMYLLATQKMAKLADIIISENDKFSFSFDTADVVNSMKFINSPENDKFTELVHFMADKTKELMSFKEELKGKTDSVKQFAEKNKKINEEVVQFRKDFIT